MAKSRTKKRVKIKAGAGTSDEFGSPVEEVNYEEFLTDIYEKQFDPRYTSRRKHPGDKYSDCIEQLKDNAKRGCPETTAKRNSPRRPAWKGSGINFVSQLDNRDDTKDPTTAKYLEHKLRKERVRLGKAPENLLDYSKESVRDFTMSGQLFQAVLHGRFFQVKSLLKTGVDVNAKNGDGYGVLVAALHVRDRDVRDRMFRYLLKRDADCGAVDEETGRSVLAWACYLDRVEQVAKLLQVSQGDLDFGHRDKSGKTALHYAVVSGNIAVVKMLVTTTKRYGLSVDIPDEIGLTPYLYSRKLGFLDICNVLLADGRASKRQFDGKLFRSGTFWAEDGLRERRREAVQLKRVEKEWYKMNGRMPLFERTNPTGQLTDSLGYLSKSQGYLGMQTTHVEGKPSHLVSSAPSMFGSSILARKTNLQNLGGHFKGIHTKNTVLHNNLSVDDDKTQPALRPPPPIPSTYEPALALLASVDKGSHVESFVRSFSAQKPNAKPGKHNDDRVAQQRKGIASFFEVLAEQRSKAFRSSVRETPKEPDPEPVSSRKKHRKTGVSSLAIIFGKDGKGRSARKRGIRVKSPPAKKPTVTGPTRKVSKASRSSTKSTPESGHHVVRSEDLKTVKKSILDNSSLELESVEF